MFEIYNLLHSGTSWAFLTFFGRYEVAFDVLFPLVFIVLLNVDLEVDRGVILRFIFMNCGFLIWFFEKLEGIGRF